MNNIIRIAGIWYCIVLVNTSTLAQMAFNMKSSVSQSGWSEPSFPVQIHQSYAIGFDVLMFESNFFFMPGLHFQNTSLFPTDVDWKKPYRNYTSIKSAKLPLQAGLYIIKNKLLGLGVHGGLAATYLIDVDKNDMVLPEDLTPIRTGLMAGALFRILIFSVHISYEQGLSRIFLRDNPTKINDNSKENIFSAGLGLYF